MTTTIFCRLCSYLWESLRRGDFDRFADWHADSKLAVVTIIIFKYDKLTVKTDKIQLYIIAELFNILLISLNTLCIVGLLWAKNKYLLTGSVVQLELDEVGVLATTNIPKFSNKICRRCRTKIPLQWPTFRKIKNNVKSFPVSAFTWIGSLCLYFVLY